MAHFQIGRFARLTAVLLLGATLAGAPALAGKGNGGGNGNGNGNKGGSSESRGQGQNKSAGRTASPAKPAAAAPVKKAKIVLAKTQGKLNGFLHASPQALAKASPKSAIGKVAKVYAGLLNDYLAPPAEGTVAPTAEEVAAALAAAANKPLTPEIIKAVNDRLLATNPDLAASLLASGKTPEDLAAEIATAL